MTLETTSSVMSEGDARRLTERIRLTALSVRDGVEKMQRLVAEAEQGQAHIALGYKSWTAYVADLFGDEPMRLPRDERREVVAWLAGEGMSVPAIAAVTGVADRTVQRDFRTAEQVVTPVTTSTPEPTAFIVGPNLSGSLDVTDWSEDEIAEVMDEDNYGVTYSNEPFPEDEPATIATTEGVIVAEQRRVDITGLDGKTYPKAAPSSPRRNPLTDQFVSAALDLDRATARLVRLADDDRFPQNREKVATANRSDLLRAIAALERVVALLD